ncbi:hypothetical protein [Caulobacter soli]|uniref:hypothetical protein n=1 Tax=Caulobacter soli TaxID=2708539 RepID=UPI0013EDAC88|nr:hypothetical protein [Caulobacter soli]
MILVALLAVSTASTTTIADLQARLGKPTVPSYTEHADADHLGVNIAEMRLKLLGGFGGERVEKTSLAMVWTLGRTKLYARKGDYRPMTQRHLYADRDGDGVIDAGALYNPRTGMVSADWNCDGVGDQMLADVK